MMDLILRILVILLTVYLINFPVYKIIKRRILQNRNSESMRMLKSFRKHVEKYKLNVGFVENAIPDCYEINPKLLKALNLTDDLHYYLKVYGFYLSDEKCNLIFGDCFVVTRKDTGTGEVVNIYKIELQPVKK